MINEFSRLKIGLDWEKKMSVYIDKRNVHIMLAGKSGTGKSESILGWWEQDNYYRHAKVLVDPSGSLAQSAYSISRGIYCSLDHDVSLNMMIAPYSDDQICDIIIESVNQMVKQTSPNNPFTVKMVDLLVIAIKWCLKNNRRSLLHVLDYVKNMSGNSETRDGITSRLQYLLNDPKTVKLLCGSNSIEWGQLIAKKQTLIMDCWGMNRVKMVFAGSLITNGIKNYFRHSKPKEYKPLSVFLDEAHLFLNPGITDVLAEGRKYNLSFCLATQSIAAIRDDIMRKVLLNVGNICTYRVGYQDAQLIAKELDMAPQDLQFIEKYHLAYLTPKARGIAKAPHPVLVREVQPPKVAPQRKAKPVWFDLEPLESYQPV